MAARDLLTVLLRATGIYFVVLNGAMLPGGVLSTISTLSSGYFGTFGTADIVFFVSPTVAVALQFLLGLLLIWLAPGISARLCPAPERAVNADGRLELAGGALLRAGLQALGVFIFFQALTPLALLGVATIEMGERETITDILTKEGLANNLAKSAACVAAGWVLVFRGHAVAAWLERLSPAAGASAPVGEIEANPKDNGGT